MSVGYPETSISLIELPQHIPKEMPYVIDDFSLAHALGFRNKTVWYALHNNLEQYEIIKIPKRRGGTRVIHAPKPMMKLLLRRINYVFLEPMHNQLGPHVTAYRKGRSIRDAVVQHIPACPVCDITTATPKKHLCPRKGLYLKMDLKDFFHSTTAAWIRHYFRSLGYSHYVAGILASLLTVRDVPGEYENELYTRTPQGSPASGSICNLVADQRLDQNIQVYLQCLNLQYCLKGDWRWKYTRYSDDLAFTCGINPPKEDRDSIIADIRNIVREAGYQVNTKKTRVTHGYHRKDMLGVVFNDKANYARNEYHNLRAIIHNCKTHGFESQCKHADQPSTAAMIVWLRGRVNWVKQINPHKGQKLLKKLQEAITQQEVQHAN